MSGRSTPSIPTGTISARVTVIEAEIPAIDHTGTSDGYCVLKCGKKEKTSAVVYKTLKPEWNLEDNYENLDQNAFFEVTIFDKDTFGSNLIGNMKIYIKDFFDKNGEEVDKWYVLGKPTGSKGDGGKVHLSVQVVGGPKIDRIVSSKNLVSEASGAKVSVDSKDQVCLNCGKSGHLATACKSSPENFKHVPQLPPNTLAIRIVKCLGLPPVKDLLGFESKSESTFSYVKLKVDKETYHAYTKPSKTFNPQYDALFKFYCVDPNCDVELKIKDGDKIGGGISEKTKAGCFIKPKDYQSVDPISRSIRLLNEKMAPGSEGKFGTMEVQIRWYNDPDPPKKEVKEVKQEFEMVETVAPTPGVISGSGISKNSSASSTNVVAGNDFDSDTEDSKLTEEQKKAKEEKKKLEEKELEDRRAKRAAEVANTVVKSGDWQIQVHIEKVKDLAARDANGTSDPYVVVKAFGEKKHTKVKKKTTNANFDDFFFFNAKNMDAQEVKESIIDIKVMDSDLIGKDDEIGSFEFDVMDIYYEKNHEIYDKWVALMLSDGSDPGCQGYLKLSITVLGPGDIPLVHDREQEKLAEDNASSDIDFTKSCIMPQSMQSKLEWLSLKLFRCYGIPAMDGVEGLSLKSAGVDAYVQVEYNNLPRKLLRTRYITDKGKDDLSATWNEEIRIPIQTPTLSNLLLITLKDYDVGTSGEVIGSFSLNLKDVRNKVMTKATWIPLYGPQVQHKPDALNHKARKIFEKMIHVQSLATCNNGMLLLSANLEPTNTILSNGTKMNLKPKKVLNIPREGQGGRESFSLRAFIASGSELPLFHLATKLGGLSDLRLQIKWGTKIIETPYVKNNNGVSEWKHLGEILNTQMPVDPLQMPDVFIYLLKGDNVPACYFRAKAQEVISGKFKELNWITLVEDPVLDCLSNEESPGNVLLCLDISQGSAPASESWKGLPAKMSNTKRQKVRVYLYQARGLSAADAGGTSDPYCTISLGAEKVKSGLRNSTVNPCWYEQFEFTMSLPDDLHLSPLLIIKIYDKDLLSSDELGDVRINLSDPRVVQGRKAGQSINDPFWYNLTMPNGSVADGQVLIGVEIITPGGDLDAFNEDIVPEFEKGFVEIIALGCRDLQPYNMFSINNSYMKFQIEGITDPDAGNAKTSSPNIRTKAARSATTSGTNAVLETQVKFTAPSRKPDGANPNFLERVLLPCRIPKNPIFAPQLELRLFDTRAGGLSKPLIGSATISLDHKIPGSNSYIPPDLNHMPFDPTIEKTPENPHVDDSDAPTCSIVSAEHIAAEEKRERKKTNDESKVEDANVLPMPKLGDEVKKKDDAVVVEIKKAEPEFEEEIPAYMKKRLELKTELEHTMEGTPFETYQLYRGQKIGRKNPTLKVAGVFKGIIRVIKSENEPPLMDLTKLFKIQPYVVRLYVRRGLNFQPMDSGGSSDPFLIVDLGKKSYNDLYPQKNDKKAYGFIPNTIEPNLFRSYEFNASFPGTSQLTIKAMDHDYFTPNELIGSTVIDLEDRLFDSRWQELGKDAATADRFRAIPTERRSLWIPSNSNPQGNIELWIDIMTPAEAKKFPIIPIELPPPEPVEVRVIIWKCRDVPASDDMSDMSDLFVKSWMDGVTPQNTDIHWRAKKGKASWNWRLKFDVSYPSKFTDIYFQLWDEDLTKYNDCLAEFQLPISRYLRKCHQKKTAINVFKKEKPKPVGEPSAQPGGAGVGDGSVVIEMTDIKKKKEDNIGKVDEKVEKKKTDEEKEAAEALKAVKTMTGYADPEDAAWIPLEKFNHKTGTRTKEGELLISLEIIPKVEAEKKVAGFGQSAPNSNPFLPPPVGRIQWSWNPFVMLQELMGPKLCRRVLSLCCCTIFIVLLVFLMPFFSSINTFLAPLLQVAAFAYTFYTVIALIILFYAWYCCIKPFFCARCYKEKDTEEIKDLKQPLLPPETKTSEIKSQSTKYTKIDEKFQVN